MQIANGRLSKICLLAAWMMPSGKAMPVSAAEHRGVSSSSTISVTLKDCSSAMSCLGSMAAFRINTCRMTV